MNFRKTLNGRHILIVDDELAIRQALEQRLTEEGAEVDTANCLQAARDRLDRGEYDVIILDNRLPDGTGLAFLSQLKERGVSAEVIMMTAYSSTQDAVRAIKSGAADYLLKPFEMDEMLVVISKTLEHQGLRREVHQLRKKDRASSTVEDIVGSSASAEELRQLITRVAQSGAKTILIHGESGTGKDLVARAIHFASPEGDQPFLNITCTALPETLLETELFGHAKGAFTDAKSSKRGLFEEAQGGTIFLDEIGDMPLSLQAKLLRFLEAKTFRRVGGLKEIELDVRVIAATNRDLPQAIREGSFRGDLYYRLNVIPIETTPLREQPQDVPELVRYFVQRFALELRRDVDGFDEAALQLLRGHSWPGNVRELKNCVERAVLLCQSRVLGVKDLPPDLKKGIGSAEDSRVFELPPQGIVIDDVIRDLLDQALIQSGGNKSNAAQLLGIHRDQVRYWVKKYNLRQWIRSRATKGATAR